MDVEKIRALLRAAAREESGKLRLACPLAFKLSAEHDIPLHEIGRICNEDGILISKCQLGCF